SESQTFGPMLNEPSARVTRRSSRVPAGTAGVVAVSRVGLETETPAAGTPPIETATPSVKPNPPTVIPAPPPARPGLGVSGLPGGTTRPILSGKNSENQSAPSAPVVMPAGSAFGVGSGNSVTEPAVVIRPTLLP